MTKDEVLMKALEMSLIELLRSVPKNARLIVDNADGISSRSHPVGYLCHKAAEALAQPAQEVNRKNKMNLIELAKECGATLDVMPDETGFYTKDAWNTQVVFLNTTDENDKPCIKALESFAQAVIENYVGISKEALEKPAQEPMAWVKDNLICPENGYETTRTEEHPKDLGWTPLYTHPAPSWQGNKEFVEISDDEIQEELKKMWDKGIIPSYSIVAFARAIEQALKEKNYG